MTKQWTPQDILELGASFHKACILTTAAQLNIFNTLAEKAIDASSVAAKFGTDLRATTIILNALAAMELLVKNDGRYSVPEDVAHLLTEQSPRNVLPMLRHQYNCLTRWAQLPRVIETGKPAETVFDSYDDDAVVAAFIGAMHVISAPIADEVIGRLGSISFEHLLDIGGASGTWTIAFLRGNSEASATILDLPPVIPMAEKRIAESGLSNRVALVTGDFYTDELPAGVDLAFLGAICHQNSRQQNRELFAKIHRALDAGGHVVIRDVVMDNSHAAPPYGALFAVNMLVATEAGGTYTFDEYSEDLRQAGFTDVTLTYQDPGMNSLITATKA